MPASFDPSIAANPFARGSTAHAFFDLQRLARRAGRIRVAIARARALVRLAVLARAHELRCAGLSPVAPAPVSAPLREAIRAMVPADTAGPAERLLDHLAALPAAPDPARVAALAELAEGLVQRPPEGATLHALCVDLHVGRREDTLARAEALPPGGERARALRLVATGVLVRAGRRASARFVGRIDRPEDALAYEPSLPLLRALCAAGAASSQAACAVLAGLAGAEAQEGRALRAAAAYPDLALSEALALVEALRHPGARRRGLLRLLGAALDAGRLEDAERIAARARGERAEGEARLALAAALGARGGRTAARRWLAGVRDPALAAEVALQRAALDLEGGLVHRAARRLRALPGRDDPRRAPPEEPRLPGEGVTEEPFGPAWRLRLEVWLAIGAPERDTLRPRPHEIDALCREPARIAQLRCRPRLRALAARRLAPLAGRHLGRLLVAELEALDITARAEELLAEVRGIEPLPAAEDALDAPLAPERAFVLGALGAQLPAGATRRDPRLADALAPARAAYDEGLALGPARERRRAVLLDVARASLRRLLAGLSAGDDLALRTVLRSRARCLVHLGGDAAAAILHRAILQCAAPLQERRALVSALADLSPRRAREAFVHRHELVTEGGRDLTWVTERLAASGALDPVAAAVYRQIHERLRDRLGDPASAWLGGYLRAFVRAVGALPGAEALAALEPLLQPSAPLPPTGEALVRALVARRDAQLARAPDAFLRALHDDPEVLCALTALAPARSARDQPAWPEARYRQAIRRLLVDVGAVAEAPLRRLRAALPAGRDVVAALLRGVAPTPALARDVPLGAGHALRYLDKRRDFLAFLRFPDCVPCCYHSGGRHYWGSMDTQRMVLSLWKDPLSFCFQVLRWREGDGDEPRGFVFGSFGLSGGRPAALLNGVYLARQTASLRAAVIGAIERELCLPLGIRQIAIACTNGGNGPLPSGYSYTPRLVLRLRALLDLGGAVVQTIYDDLSTRVNEEIRTGYDVWWRDLEEVPAPVLQAAS